MSTITRTILVILVVILGLLVVLPFILKTIGIDVFRLGGGGGGIFSGGEKEILISFDAKKWTRAEFMRGKNVKTPASFLDIEFHPREEGVIFLGTQKNGLWKSVDAGKTWHASRDQKGILAPASDVYKIAVASSHPQVMYLAVFQNNRGRVLKSEDGGQTFREVYFVSADRFGVFDIVVDPNNAEHVLIATGEGGVLETEDGGASWRIRRWFGEALTRLIVNPANMGEMYVISKRGVISKTKDGGATWTNALEGFTRQSRTQGSEQTQFTARQSPLMFNFGEFGGGAVTYFEPDPFMFSTVHMIRNGNAWRTQNGGENWEELKVIVPPTAGLVNAFAAYPGQNRLLFATVGNQLYRSDDAGRNWSFSIMPASGRVLELFIPGGSLFMMLAVVSK